MWSSLVRLSRGFVLALLQRIEVGTVVVTDSSGAVFVCGAPQPNDAGPKTEVRVLKDTFWVRMLLFADMVRNPLSPWLLKLVARALNRPKLRSVRKLGLCGEFHVR